MRLRTTTTTAATLRRVRIIRSSGPILRHRGVTRRRRGTIRRRGPTLHPAGVIPLRVATQRHAAMAVVVEAATEVEADREVEVAVDPVEAGAAHRTEAVAVPTGAVTND